jgi:N4-gp56 family major capsid protein
MPRQNLSTLYNPALTGYCDRALLPRRNRKYIWQGHGDQKSMPENEGNLINWHRYGHLDDATGDLADGVTPEGAIVERTPVSDQVRPKGNYILYTDQLEKIDIDRNVVRTFREVLSDNINSTRDVLCRDSVVAGTQVHYTNGASSAEVTTVIAKKDVAIVQNHLDNNHVMAITEKIDLNAKYGAHSIEEAFVCNAHLDCLEDLERCTGWTAAKDYASQKGLLPDERGSIGKVRFCLNSSGKVIRGGGATVTAETTTKQFTLVGGTAKADVYIYQVFGKNYYGEVRLGKGSQKSIIKPIGTGGSDDALDQRGSLGWKCWVCNPILDDDAGMRIEAACTQPGVTPPGVTPA